MRMGSPEASHQELCPRALDECMSSLHRRNHPGMFWLAATCLDGLFGPLCHAIIRPYHGSPGGSVVKVVTGWPHFSRLQLQTTSEGGTIRTKRVKNESRINLKYSRRSHAMTRSVHVLLLFALAALPSPSCGCPGSRLSASAVPPLLVRSRQCARRRSRAGRCRAG